MRFESIASIVVTCLPATAAIVVTQARIGLPSTCTVHAPQTAMPQPNLVPVYPSSSRKAHNNGVSGVADNCTVLPLSESEIMTFPQRRRQEPVGRPMEFSIKRSCGRIIASIAADVRAGARGAGSARARDGHCHPRLDLPQGRGTDADRPRWPVRGHSFGRLSRGRPGRARGVGARTRALQKWSGTTIAGTTICCGDWAPAAKVAWTSGSSGSIPRRTGSPSRPCHGVSSSVNVPRMPSCSIQRHRSCPSAPRSGWRAVRPRRPDYRSR